jgi:hypothetical protein
MTARRIFAGGVIVSALLTSGIALSAGQPRPNFSGTWIFVTPAKSAGQEQVIKHDDKTLSMVMGSRSVVHQLDGVERREARPMRGGDVVMLTRAAWDGRTVVVTITTSYPNNMKTQAKEVWSLDAEGRLVINFTESAEGQAPRVVQAMLTRKK